MLVLGYFCAHCENHSKSVQIKNFFILRCRASLHFSPPCFISYKILRYVYLGYKVRKNSLEHVGLKFFLVLASSLSKSDMFDCWMVSPSSLACPNSSHAIMSVLAFNRFKSALALGRIVYGECRTMVASSSCVLHPSLLSDFI